MNREIKFRAWDKENNRIRDCDVMILNDIYLAPSGVGFVDKDFNQLNNLTPMQFTGLKDKFGIEIYEGDILKSLLDDRWFDWLVSFNEGAFIVQNIGVDGYLMDEYRLNSPMAMDRLVIGNIYENPELIKQQEAKK